MPGSAAENEPSPPEYQRQDQGNPEELWETLWVWYIRSLIIGSLAVSVIRLFQNDEIRLHVLHKSSRIFGDIARVFGSWAIQSEKAYYDVVDSIPH